MLIFIVLALLAGILVGTITGLLPGIHINLVSAGLLYFSGSLLANNFSAEVLVVFLVAIAVTHIFIDYIPSIFLGAPDEDNILSVLPGHEMLIKGEAYSAVVYSLYGCLIGIILIILFSPLFFIYLPKLYPYAERIMPFILILTSFFLIFFEKNNRLWALIIFFLSGMLGLATLTLPLKDSLLPLFTGLFGVSSLITSVVKKTKLPKQKVRRLREIKLEKNSFLKSILAAILASPLCSFLPGLGSGQAAVIGSQIVSDINRKGFLFLLGIINILVTGLSFITLYSIDKARTGIAVGVGKIISLDIHSILLITIIIVLTGILAFFVSLYIARIFSKIISKLNYQVLSLSGILFLIIIVFIFSGILGFLILITSTILGLTCIHANIRRTHLMGCLIIPAIIFSL